MEAGLHEISWIDASGIGHDDVTVTLTPDGCVAVGHVTAFEPDRYEVYYRVECDAHWRTRYVSVAETLTRRSIELDVSAEGQWIDDHGDVLSGLLGAADVDIAATPFTNALPVHRLDLEVGESAEIVTAWIDVPALHVHADPQRYTRLAPLLYRYESLDSEFARDIVVDDEGFVVDYPGLFHRLRPAESPVRPPIPLDPGRRSAPARRRRITPREGG
ncbi:putative glycolipid-binding domain-containing protein [Herbiconiux moechotypicola]|uniref:putative glycolipid-binding domain-containing protein n=1 Tax=Herbiconiux moechotypicola TaxID=637393 RepID=UPI00217CE653|nr:putative glycolipid-binding domain-containing protein [Herbiconiux moechotypicola]MCS5730774.1 putative glycolipid-binding domain-containing protein [Herbiconiux moechotypicola]